MDPLYSYSMGIVVQFPHLLIYYHHYVSCCNPTEVNFSMVLWQQIRTLKMMDLGWGEFDRITTRGLGKVRVLLRLNFWDGTNAETSRGWYLTSGLARMKSRNDYIEFINRERPHGIMWLKFRSYWCLFVPVELFIYVTWFLVMWHKSTPQ